MIVVNIILSDVQHGHNPGSFFGAGVVNTREEDKTPPTERGVGDCPLEMEREGIS